MRRIVTAVRCPPADSPPIVGVSVPNSLFPFCTSQVAAALAIVRTRRVWMFRRKPVFDADNGLAGVVGDPLKHRILQVGAPEHPAAAVETIPSAAYTGSRGRGPGSLTLLLAFAEPHLMLPRMLPYTLREAKGSDHF